MDQTFQFKIEKKAAEKTFACFRIKQLWLIIDKNIEYNLWMIRISFVKFRLQMISEMFEKGLLVNE